MLVPEKIIFTPWLEVTGKSKIIMDKNMATQYEQTGELPFSSFLSLFPIFLRVQFFLRYLVLHFHEEVKSHFENLPSQ